MQVGQYMDYNGTEGLSRLLHKEGGTNVFLHGENVDLRFLRSHYAKRQGVIIPSEPQQSRMVSKGIASRHLEAIARILQAEVSERQDSEKVSRKA